ncbi:MAG: iron chelate uptake ABC transporter family permease subunit [Paracoccaceae bacterium]
MTLIVNPADMRRAYTAQVTRRYTMIALVFSLLALSFFLDVATGPGKYDLSTVFDVLADPMSHGVRLKVIVWDYRLPVAITAVLVGALLAVAGAQMQTILNNSLAELWNVAHL